LGGTVLPVALLPRPLESFHAVTLLRSLWLSVEALSHINGAVLGAEAAHNPRGVEPPNVLTH
jgi:hypothetical protein